jgi:hypothetical protein
MLTSMRKLRSTYRPLGMRDVRNQGVGGRMLLDITGMEEWYLELYTMLGTPK